MEERKKMLMEFIGVASILFEYGTNPVYKGRDPFMEQIDLASRLNKSQIDFQIYGRNDEKKAMRNFIDSLVPNVNVGKFQAAFNILIPLVRNRLKREVLPFSSWFFDELREGIAKLFRRKHVPEVRIIEANNVVPFQKKKI